MGYPVSRRAANLAGAAAPPNDEEKAADEMELAADAAPTQDLTKKKSVRLLGDHT